MESYGEESEESDAFSSEAELAGTVIKGPSPETNVGRLLVEAEDSDPAYSWIMIGEEPGGLLCSHASMIVIDLSDSSIRTSVIDMINKMSVNFGS